MNRLSEVAMERLERSTFFIIFFSKNYLKDQNCLNQLEYAIEIQKEFLIVCFPNAKKELKDFLKDLRKKKVKFRFLGFGFPEKLADLISNHLKGRKE
jgi:hypothetical protein